MTPPKELPLAPLADAALSVAMEAMLERALEAFVQHAHDNDGFDEAVSLMAESLIEDIGAAGFKRQFRADFKAAFARMRAQA